MLSRGWVLVLRAVGLLFAAAIWLFCFVIKLTLDNTATWVGAAGMTSVWMGMMLLMFLVNPKVFLPEIVPDCFYQVKQTRTTLRVAQSTLLAYVALVLICLYLFAIPLDLSIGPNRSHLVSLMAGLAGGVAVLVFLVWIVRNWPMQMAFIVDDEGVKLCHSGGCFTAISYEDIIEITVSRRQLFRANAFVISGKVVVGQFRFFSLGNLKRSEKDYLRVPRFWHRGFRNEEVLERILAHCGDQVKVKYVKKLSQKY